jgi:S1-C subfamily serine protease
MTLKRPCFNSGPRGPAVVGPLALLLVCGWSACAQSQEPALEPGQPVPQADKKDPTRSDDVFMLLGMDVRTEDRVVHVTDVRAGGAAAAVGMQPGDIIIAVDGRRVRSRDDMNLVLEKVKQDDKVAIEALRDGQELTVNLLAPERPRLAQVTVDSAELEAGILGMSLAEGGNGRVRVEAVSPASPASTAGLREGDILIGFDDYQVTTLKELTDFARKLLERKKPGDEIDILAVRDDQEQPFIVLLPEQTTAQPVASPSVPPALADGEVVLCMVVREGADGMVSVLEVSPNSPPAVAGVLPGDQIVSLDETKIFSLNDLISNLNLYVQGDRVSFGLNRQDKFLATEVVIGPCEIAEASGPPTPVAASGDSTSLAAELAALRMEVATLKAEQRRMQEEFAGLLELLDVMTTRLEELPPQGR